LKPLSFDQVFWRAHRLSYYFFPLRYFSVVSHEDSIDVFLITIGGQSIISCTCFSFKGDIRTETEKELSDYFNLTYSPMFGETAHNAGGSYKLV